MKAFNLLSFSLLYKILNLIWRMKGFYGCVYILLSITVSGYGQSEGDYRSRQSGDWSSATTWQVFTSGSWNNVETAGAGSFQNITPTDASGDISIQSGHSVT